MCLGLSARGPALRSDRPIHGHDFAGEQIEVVVRTAKMLRVGESRPKPGLPEDQSRGVHPCCQYVAQPRRDVDEELRNMDPLFPKYHLHRDRRRQFFGSTGFRVGGSPLSLLLPDTLAQAATKERVHAPRSPASPLPTDGQVGHLPSYEQGPVGLDLWDYNPACTTTSTRTSPPASATTSASRR